MSPTSSEKYVYVGKLLSYRLYRKVHWPQNYLLLSWVIGLLIFFFLFVRWSTNCLNPNNHSVSISLSFRWKMVFCKRRDSGSVHNTTLQINHKQLFFEITFLPQYAAEMSLWMFWFHQISPSLRSWVNFPFYINFLL